MYNSYNYNFGTLILRLFVALMMLLHGYAKLKHGISPIEGMLNNNGLPTILVYGVYITEIVAPLLLIIGYKTRFAASLILINMIFAIFLVHVGDISSFTKQGGLVLELQYFYIFTSLSIVLLGAGKFSVDRN